MARERSAGVTAYLSVSQTVNEPFTMQALCNSSDTGTAAYFLNNQQLADINQFHRLRARDPNGPSFVLEAFSNDGSGGSADATVDGWTVDTWYRGIGVWASSSSRAVYLDTSTAKDTNTSTESPSGLDSIAAPSPGAPDHDSRVQGFLLYLKALSDAEVDYGAGRPRISPYAYRDLLPDHHWCFHGTDGAQDVAGGWDMTETGTLIEFGGPEYRGPRAVG